MAARAPIVRYSPTRNSDSLRCYWRGISDGTLTDFALPNKTYTTSNLAAVSTPGGPPPPWISSVGKSLQATTEGYLSADTAPISSKGNDFSFCIRFYLDTLGSPPPDMILFRNGTNRANGYSLRLVDDTFGSFDLKLFDEVNATSYTLATGIPQQVWYTVGIRVDTGDKLDLWVNGSSGSQIPVELSGSSSETVWFSGGASNLGYGFLGYISEFIFYDTSMPDSYFTNITPNTVFAGK